MILHFNGWDTYSTRKLRRYANRIANGYDDAERAGVAHERIVGKCPTSRRIESAITA